MHRFYCPNSDFTSSQAFIDDKDELHHLRNVLRLKKNSKVQIFDGKGNEASGNLLSVSSNKATVQILSVNQFIQTGPSITLACALPKKSKFELIIEKVTELGVDEIIPLTTQRTEVKLPEKRLNNKRLRFQSIALNAAKQSQRALVPMVHPITDFSSALKSLTETTTVIIPSLTNNTENLLTVLERVKSEKKISFLIGPEGDFTSEEYGLAHDRGCIPVTLGPTILRVETAAISALSCAHLFFHT